MSERGTRPATAAQGRSANVFPEIQALRVVAVAGVVIYHLWPQRLSGGYVGVDVFFVISGFLITSHLFRQWTDTGRIGLGSFYARRARRLLPAAMTVLAATALATWWLLPLRTWPQVFTEIVAAAGYFENWVLAGASVNYLAQNIDIASPVQHYWSLSVEEQFYLVWPLLIVVVGALWIRRHPGIDRARARGVLAIVLGAVLVVSLALSVWTTATNPGPAYFVTYTRGWEFAAGGLLALFYRRPAGASAVRAAASWVGFAAIAVVMLRYTPATPFPGYLAIVPVAATVLVIAAADPTNRWAPGMLTRLRPVQYLGDISYSTYLWHWPLIIFAPYLIGHVPTTRDKLVILALTLVLAVLSRQFIENPVRTAPFLAQRPARFTALAAVLALVPLVAFSAGVGGYGAGFIATQTAAGKKLIASGSDCLGAGYLLHPSCGERPVSHALIPGTSAAPTDDVNTLACWSTTGVSVLHVCGHGPTKGATLRVALIGDSHSNQYLAAIETLAKTAHWHVDVYGKDGCVWTAATQAESPDWVANCKAWQGNVNRRLAAVAPYDVIITSYKATSPFAKPATGTTDEAIVAGFEKVWKPVIARGTKIVAILDNPEPRPDYLACIDAHPNDPGPACARSQSTSLDFFDGLPQAVSQTRGAYLLDLTKWFCRNGSCEPVIGNVIVYRDDSHLTSSYTRTMAPILLAGVRRLTGLDQH